MSEEICDICGSLIEVEEKKETVVMCNICYDYIGVAQIQGERKQQEFFDMEVR